MKIKNLWNHHLEIPSMYSAIFQVNFCGTPPDILWDIQITSSNPAGVMWYYQPTKNIMHYFCREIPWNYIYIYIYIYYIYYIYIYICIKLPSNPKWVPIISRPFFLGNGIPLKPFTTASPQLEVQGKSLFGPGPVWWWSKGAKNGTWDQNHSLTTIIGQSTYPHVRYPHWQIKP